jgi:hypothetical protein
LAAALKRLQLQCEEIRGRRDADLRPSADVDDTGVTNGVYGPAIAKPQDRRKGWHHVDRDAFTVGEGTIDLVDCLSLDDAKLAEPYPGAFRPAK